MILKELKKGEYFTRKNIPYPTDNQVYIRGDYDRTSKKYSCLHFKKTRKGERKWKTQKSTKED